jgi:SWI/SNF-related matrix-associated actin-dependent regulator 1 of chromatin subfamily A
MPITLPIDITNLGSGPYFVIRGGSPRGGDDVHRAIRSWPGWKRDQATGTSFSVYRAPCTPSVVLGIRTGYVQLQWSIKAAKERDRLLQQLHAFHDCLRHKPHPWTKTPTERKPMPHQQQAIRAAECMGNRVLLSDDMGLGKTATALWIMHRAKCNRLTVLCPASVKRNWEREIAETLGPERICIIIDGSRKKRADQFAELQSAVESGGKVVCIINYDLLLHLAPHQLEILKHHTTGEGIICDESHALKSRKAQRTKLTAQLTSVAEECLLLTGTPVRNMVDDLYTQISIIRPQTWASWQDFSNRYLDVQPVNFGKKTVRKTIGSKNVDKLNEIVNTVQIRRRKEDVIDLPEKTRTTVELSLDPDTKRIYDRMKDYALVALSEVADGTSLWDPKAQTAVEAAMRCEQIAQGFVGGIPEPVLKNLRPGALKHAIKIKGRPHELVFPDSPKIAWTTETIQSLLTQGDAPVIFSRFNAPMQYLAQWCDENGIVAAWLHGALSSAAKDECVRSFQDGHADVFLCQVTMAEGFNLVRSQDVIFFGRDWSPAVNAQAEDRCHRIGQKGTVNVQIPIVLKTVEAHIHKRLDAKSDEARAAIKALTLSDLRTLL